MAPNMLSLGVAIILTCSLLVSGQTFIRENVFATYFVSNVTHSYFSTLSRSLDGHVILSITSQNDDPMKGPFYVFSSNKVWTLTSLKPTIISTANPPAYRTSQSQEVTRTLPTDTLRTRVFFANLQLIYGINVSLTVLLNRNVKFSTIPKELDNFDQVSTFNYTHRLTNSTETNLYLRAWMGLETQHLPPGIILLFLLLFILVLCVLFQRSLPLKSRGIVPFVSSFGFIVVILVRIIYNATASLEVIYKSSCYIDAIFVTPVFLSIFVSIFHQFFRYLLMKHIFLNQEYLANQISRDFHSKWYFKVMRVVRTARFQILIYLSHLLLFILMYTMSYGFQTCGSQSTSLVTVIAADIMGYIISIIIAIEFLLVLAYDFYLSYSVWCTCQIKKAWKSDGYLFSFEFYFFGLFLIFPYWIVMAIIERFIPSWIMYVQFFFYLLIYVQTCLFPLNVTIINWIRRKCTKAPKSDILLAILLDSYGHELLTGFCKSEFSFENILCWDDIQRYKMSPNEEIASKIYRKFLNGRESELEVNVQQNVCNKIKIALEMHEIVPKLFDEVENAIMLNLSDTFSRFIISSEYRSYQDQQKYFKEVIQAQEDGDERRRSIKL